MFYVHEVRNLLRASNFRTPARPAGFENFRLWSIGGSGRLLRHVRGRDASYLAPPAQIRTGPIRAYGLYGALFVKEASTHFCRPLSFHSFVRPAPQAFSRPDRIFASPSRTAAVKDGASSAPPKACP